MKLTRHNGRSGKHGVYNPKHNDRKFNLENSEHIDAERERQNIYWDCYRGYVQSPLDGIVQKQGREGFQEIELMYYEEHYGDYIRAQNKRNEKTRHTERNRTPEDLLKNRMTCPEETIYQIGKVEESVSGEKLFAILNDFIREIEQRFGEHVHILDWALHMDEGTPHIHERHVFDCENKYGEICPQQEKALEKLGIPLPEPDKPRSRTNNRKKTYDAVCRTILFDICRRHGLELEEEPEYGGRDYLEKQDYILMKLRREIAEKEKVMDSLVSAVEDMDQVMADVAEAAYNHAVDVVTETVVEKTKLEDIALAEETKRWTLSPERKAPPAQRKYAADRLDGLILKMKRSLERAVLSVKRTLMSPEVKERGKEKIQEAARKPLREKLRRAQEVADDYNKNRQKKKKYRDMER